MEIQPTPNYSLAINYVVSLLSRRDYAEYELRCKMQEKHFSEAEIHYAITHCQAKNWQSDQRFAENYLRHRSQRGYGVKRIRQELLKLKGISEETWQQALTALEEDNGICWQEMALQVLRKKFPTFQQKQAPKQKQKIWQYMLSHGFDSDDFAHFIDTCDDEWASHLPE